MRNNTRSLAAVPGTTVATIMLAVFTVSVDYVVALPLLPDRIEDRDALAVFGNQYVYCAGATPASFPRIAAGAPASGTGTCP